MHLEPQVIVILTEDELNVLLEAPTEAHLSLSNIRHHSKYHLNKSL